MIILLYVSRVKAGKYISSLLTHWKGLCSLSMEVKKPPIGGMYVSLFFKLLGEQSIVSQPIQHISAEYRTERYTVC